jgi:hypothetical protein
VREIAKQLITDGTTIPSRAGGRAVHGKPCGRHRAHRHKKDLEDFGVVFDNYYRERSLFERSMWTGRLTPQARGACTSRTGRSGSTWLTRR